MKIYCDQMFAKNSSSKCHALSVTFQKLYSPQVIMRNISGMLRLFNANVSECDSLSHLIVSAFNSCEKWHRAERAMALDGRPSARLVFAFLQLVMQDGGLVAQKMLCLLPLSLNDKPPQPLKKPSQQLLQNYNCPSGCSLRVTRVSSRKISQGY